MNAILCVDTNRGDLQKLSQLIRANGYICIPADNAEEAVHAFSSSCVDLVILDEGPEESKLSVRLKRLRKVPMVMLADNVERTEKPEGVDLLCPKPVQARQLLSTIGVLLHMAEPQAA